MASITVVLPEKALEALKMRSESEGKALEKIVSEPLLNELNIPDPEARTQLHLGLST